MITGQTRTLVILADPIAHVRTPQVLNPRLEAEGVDAVLVPLEVPPEALEAALRGLAGARNFAGAVITLPHKTAVPALCDALSDRAAAAQSVNVVRRRRDGSLYGDLLDGEGFVRGFEQTGVTLCGKRVFLAGAGGAASAIAFALAGRGVAALTIANRSAAKAGALIARLSARFPDVAFTAAADPAGHDIAINGTSLGLRPGDALPFDPDRLDPGTLVAEVIMQPATTALLRAATARGLTTHPGRHMLEGQLTELLRFLTHEEDEK
ncbi:shikimate dehydrogenase family protein [Pseudodonghicola flavimaris]|uniref:shikimate dehydrogenase (NADP(+)) n=1 Tax=Pseudodonghicola flavimaris TaxID=3050036 RepID=A0ABT7F8L2_9RHOB|nr:shikimate dehydrogenase [Pseudodonghicola flavimaris]MDK3020952.1 shikimate dehydrogenase [Pseudodonghicola flavimaris]